MGSHRVGHNWSDLAEAAAATPKLYSGGSGVKTPHANSDVDLSHESGRSPGEENGYSLWYSCLGNPVDREAWWAIIYRFAKSWHSWASLPLRPLHNTGISTSGNARIEVRTEVRILSSWKGTSHPSELVHRDTLSVSLPQPLNCKGMFFLWCLWCDIFWMFVLFVGDFIV